MRTLGKRRELWPLHANIGAVAHDGDVLGHGGFGEVDAQARRYRMRHRYVGDATPAEKRTLAFVSAIHELIDQHKRSRRQILLERTTSRQRDKIGHAGAFEHVDIGPIVDIGRRVHVSLIVA